VADGLSRLPGTVAYLFRGGLGVGGDGVPDGLRAVPDSVPDRPGVFLDDGFDVGGLLVLCVRNGSEDQGKHGGRGRPDKSCLHGKLSYDTRTGFCTARLLASVAGALQACAAVPIARSFGQTRPPMRIDRL